MTYRFTPPTYDLKPVHGHRLLTFYPMAHGTAVIKTGATYREVNAAVSQEVFDEADAVYLGGHTYQVSDDEAALLIAAGYEPTLE